VREATLAAVLALATGCGQDGQDAATCASATGHHLAAGCALATDDGDTTDPGQALAWCEAEQALAEGCGCAALFRPVLDCLSGTDGTTCGACQAALFALHDCEWAATCPEIKGCARVVGHFYGQGCTLTSDGSPVLEADAVAWCEGARELAPACGCEARLEDALRCLSAAGPGQCAYCNDELSRYLSCIAGC